MSKIGKDAIAGMKEAIAIARGEKKPHRIYTAPVRVPETIDVAVIRRRLGLTQAEFAARYGFSAGNVRNWEQGHRQPDGATRVYLKVIDLHPAVVDKALADLRDVPAPRMIPARHAAMRKAAKRQARL